MGSDGKKKKSRVAVAREGWNAFMKFLYNSNDGTVLGRNGNSWSKIGVFYFFYYGFLACLFAASISIVLSTLDEYTPRYQTRVQTPGVAIQPKIPSNIEQTSNIIYTVDPKDKSYKRLVDQMDKFLYAYAPENQTAVKGFQNCTDNQPPNLQQEYEGDQQALGCVFDKKKLGPCVTPPYGYDVGKPCIFIKLNRIIDWFPVGFTNLSRASGYSVSGAPDLLELLNTYGLSYKPYLIYTVCFGDTDKDKAALNQNDMSNDKYYPADMGLPFAYFPYKGLKREPGYVNPIVAVQFTNVTRDVTIDMVCKVYALNVRDNKDMAEGYFRFQMEIKNPK